MGKYVLLEFDDNLNAGFVVDSIRNNEKLDEADYKALGIVLLASSRVLAVFNRPAQLCRCEKDQGNSLRGKKFGWWVCPVCKRPKSRMGQTLRNMLNPKLENTTRVGEPSLNVHWVEEDGQVRTSVLD